MVFPFQTLRKAVPGRQPTAFAVMVFFAYKNNFSSNNFSNRCLTFLLSQLMYSSKMREY
jgi:hypothetical protein